MSYAGEQVARFGDEGTRAGGGGATRRRDGGGARGGRTEGTRDGGGALARRRGGGDAWKGLAAGLAGGLVASFVMNRFQSAWSRRTHGVERSHGAQSLQTGTPEGGDRWPTGQRDVSEAGGRRDATERVAEAVAENAAGRELTREGQEAGGTLVHYAFGASVGTAYGLAAEFAPAVSAGLGLPFGVVFWVVADELVTPALGLSKRPDEYPPSILAYGLASHLVYGAACELTRRAVRRAL
jgi:putative membrane protein